MMVRVRVRLRPRLALLLCLVLVGILRMSTPELLPGSYDVRPDRAGVARTELLTATLEDVQFGTKVLWVGERDLPVETEHAFVVVRLKLEAHRQSLRPTLLLHTTDGPTYSPLGGVEVPEVQSVDVGFWARAPFVFEVPRERLQGAWVTVGGSPAFGITPLSGVARFDLPQADVWVEPVTVAAIEEGAS